MEPAALIKGTEHLASLANNFGLGVTLAVVIVLLFGGLLVYVLRENSRREQRVIDDKKLYMEESNKREERLNILLGSVVDKIGNDLNEHDKRTAEAMRTITEAARYQREEHQEISKQLNDTAIILTGLKTEVENIRRTNDLKGAVRTA